MAGTRPLSPEQQAAVAVILPTFPLRARALMAFLLNTGYRVTEALSLSVGDVWEGGRVRPRVRVARAGMKCGKGPRCRSVEGRAVVLNQTVSLALAEYLFARFGSAGPTDPAEPLFLSRQGTRRLSRWQANRLVHAVLLAAGVEGAGTQGWYGSHSLRKVYARRIYEATGHDIVLTKAALGHRSIESTQHYLSVDDDSVERAVLALDTPRPLAGPGAARLAEPGMGSG